MMLEEVKALREETVTEWENILKQATDITAEYLGNIDQIERELEEREKEMHKQVETILAQCRETFDAMKASGLAELQT